MKNTNKKGLQNNRKLLPFLIPFLFLTCTQKEDQNNAEIQSNGPSLPEQVSLTQEQYEASNMELGQMQDYAFGNSIKINGTIDVPPEGRAQISSYYGGYVRGLKILAGQQVRKGQLLFTLENPEFVQMQQDFLEAKGQLAYLQSDFERQQTLSGENIASQKNFLKAESEYNIMLAKVAGLKKKLSLLNLKPESLTAENLRASISIYAPIAGYITEVNTVNGSFLSPGDEALGIINTDHIHLELHVFENHIAHLQKGQLIRFRLPDSPDLTYEAEVFVIGKKIDSDNRMINVHAHLKEEKRNEEFTPGMYVEAEAYSTNGPSKALPEDAVVEVSGQHYILLRKNRGKGGIIFEKREVNIGKTADGLTEILNGKIFEPSDEFLIKGAFNLIN